MVKTKWLLLCLLTCTALFSFSQQTAANIEELFEELAEEVDESVDLSEISERWHYYLRHPIDLNKTEGADLAELLFLSPQLIDNLLSHRAIAGSFINVLELQSVDGFSERVTQLLLPFVRIGGTDFFQKVEFGNFEHDFMVRYGRTLEKAKGYQITDSTRSRYLGDRNAYLIRYRANHKDNLRIAVNLDKDAGEPFFKNAQRYGFDFFGFSVAVKNLGAVKQLVVGDFAMQIGQGLSMWNGLGFGKGALVQHVARQGVGLKPYTSLNEVNFLRGLATTIGFGAFELTPYLSYRTVDGKITETDETRYLSTVAITGLHRTPTELAYRHAARQLTYGLNSVWKVKRLKVGLHVSNSYLDAYKQKGSSTRQLYDFEGRDLANLSIYTNYTFRNTHLFGEYANSFDGGQAWLLGAIGSLTPKLSTVLIYRDYARDFHTFYGQGFGESDNTANECGVYTGLVYQLARKLQWASYVDYYRFPWLKYRVDEPSSGIDLFSQLTYIWYKKGQLSLRYRHRLREQNYSGEDDRFEGLIKNLKQQLRIDFRYNFTPAIGVRSRVEGNLFQTEIGDEPQTGWMAYQDLVLKTMRTKIQGNVRVAYFQTDSYDNRMYAYENDVLYASRFALYYTKGWRCYLNLRYRLTRQIDLWTKYGIFYYPDRESVGTALEEIGGNKKSEVRMQLRWRL